MATNQSQKGQPTATDVKSVVVTSAQNIQKDVTGLSYAGVLTTGMLTKNKAFTDALSKIRDDLSEVDHVFIKNENKNVPRFYINSQIGQATLIGNDDKSVDITDPYNKMVAVVTGPHPDISTALFKVESRIFIDQPSREAADKFVLYASKVRKGQLELQEASADNRNLLFLMNRFVAVRAWKHFLGYDNVLTPPSAQQAIRQQAADLKGSKRINPKRIDITYRRLLLRETEKWFTPENVAYGHALVHGLTLVTDDSVSTNTTAWEQILSSHKSLRPGWSDLELIGILPAVGLKKFKNLFTPLEWQVIEESNLLRFEQQVQEIRQSNLAFSEIKGIIQKCDHLKSLLKAHPYFEHYVAVKKERLLLCGNWKRDQRKGDSLNMWKEVGLRWDKSPRTREAFGIGRVHNMAQKLVGVSYQTLNAQIAFDVQTETYVIRDLNSVDLKENLALNLVSEFISLINKS
jgi:hypothetical protein